MVFEIIFSFFIIVFVGGLFFLNYYFFIYRQSCIYRLKMKIVKLELNYWNRQILRGREFEEYFFYKKLPSDWILILQFWKKLKLKSYYTNDEILELLCG